MTIAYCVVPRLAPNNFLAPPILITSCVVHVIRTRVRGPLLTEYFSYLFEIKQKLKCKTMLQRSDTCIFNVLFVFKIDIKLSSVDSILHSFAQLSSTYKSYKHTYAHTQICMYVHSYVYAMYTHIHTCTYGYVHPYAMHIHNTYMHTHLHSYIITNSQSFH